jgi:hypothetical protein
LLNACIEKLIPELIKNIFEPIARENKDKKLEDFFAAISEGLPKFLELLEGALEMAQISLLLGFPKVADYVNKELPRTITLMIA